MPSWLPFRLCFFCFVNSPITASDHRRTTHMHHANPNRVDDLDQSQGPRVLLAIISMRSVTVVPRRTKERTHRCSQCNGRAHRPCNAVCHQINHINPIHKHRSTRRRPRVLSQPAMAEGGSGGYVVLMICVPLASLMTTVCVCLMHPRMHAHRHLMRDHARNAYKQRRRLTFCQRRRWRRRRPCPGWAASSGGSSGGGSGSSDRAVSSRGPGVGLLRAGRGGAWACVPLCVCGGGGSRLA